MNAFTHPHDEARRLRAILRANTLGTGPALYALATVAGRESAIRISKVRVWRNILEGKALSSGRWIPLTKWETRP